MFPPNVMPIIDAAYVKTFGRISDYCFLPPVRLNTWSRTMAIPLVWWSWKRVWFLLFGTCASAGGLSRSLRFEEWCHFIWGSCAHKTEESLTCAWGDDEVISQHASSALNKYYKKKYFKTIPSALQFLVQFVCFVEGLVLAWVLYPLHSKAIGHQKSMCENWRWHFADVMVLPCLKHSWVRMFLVCHLQRKIYLDFLIQFHCG